MPHTDALVLWSGSSFGPRPKIVRSAEVGRAEAAQLFPEVVPQAQAQVPGHGVKHRHGEVGADRREEFPRRRVRDGEHWEPAALQRVDDSPPLAFPDIGGVLLRGAPGRDPECQLRPVR